MGTRTSVGRSTLGPPSVARAVDRGEVTVSSDIYSLGVVVAQALTGLSGDVAQIRGIAPRRTSSTAPPTSTHDSLPSVDAFVTDLRSADDCLGRPRRRPRPTRRSTSTTRTRDCGRSTPPTPSTSTAANGSSNGSSHGSAQPGTRGRFIAVVGPSGSGKSSVVKAGLLPAIRRGAVPLSGSWFTIEMTPAPHPFEELEDGAARRRRRSAGLAARAARGRTGLAARASPRVAQRRLAAVARDRPVRGAVHAGRRGHGEPVPRHARERRHRRPESGPCRRHAARRLLRPTAAAPWSR